MTSSKKKSSILLTLKDKLYHWIYEPLVILSSDKRALAGLIIVLFYILMATIGPLIIPLDLSPNMKERYQPPSWKHPLGTDFAGRDILAQLVHGARDVLLVAFIAGLVTVAIGTIVGLISGYVGGKLDLVLSALIDIFLTIPGFPLLMVIAAWLTGSRVGVNAFIAGLMLSITTWAGLARAVRSQVLSIKEEAFIEAVKTLGLGKFHIIFSEILPNLMSYIVMNFMLSIISAIYSYVGLMALGLIPYTPGNWGSMIHMAQAYVGTITGAGCWYILAPSMAIVILQIGLVFLSNGIDKIFNPRLRER